jgi:four helix bundle protein
MGGRGDAGKVNTQEAGRAPSHYLHGGDGGTNIRSHRELRVYVAAFEAAMGIYRLTRAFPQEERFSMTSQLTRSSRSVCANLAEAWRKRRYEAAFVAKLNDAETEACEVQVWLEFAVECGYIEEPVARMLSEGYDKIMAQLVTMISQSEKWVIR